MPEVPRNLNYEAVFRRDVELILLSFAERKTASFLDFVCIWDDLKCYMIFGLKKFVENVYRYFLEDAMKVVASYMSSHFNHFTRIGALYIYYALYSSEKQYPKAKARFTLERWQDLSRFIEAAQSLGQREVVYVFNTLLLENAFHFAHTENWLSVRSYTQSAKSNIVVPSQLDRKTLFMCLKDPGFENEILQDLTAIHKEYMEAKRKAGIMNVTSMSTILDIDVMRRLQTSSRLLNEGTELASGVVSTSQIVIDSCWSREDDPKADYVTSTPLTIGSDLSSNMSSNSFSDQTVAATKRHLKADKIVMKPMPDEINVDESGEEEEVAPRKTDGREERLLSLICRKQKIQRRIDGDLA